jgi:hypothetical protein
MFHMTTHSGLFKNSQELMELKFYKASGNRRRRGSEEYVPLLEGEMIQIYNSRYASVGTNPNNLSGHGVTIRATIHRPKLFAGASLLGAV